MQREAATKPARTNLAPIPFECDPPFLKIVGELPRELKGMLYPQGPLVSLTPRYDDEIRPNSL